MRSYKSSIIDILRPFFGAIIGITLVSGLLWFRLSSIPPGISPTEQPVIQTVQARSLSASDILDNPLYLPHKLGLYAAEKLGFTSVLAVRGIGVLFGTAAVAAIYLLLKRWHTRRVALLGSLLFLTSSWLLHITRLGVPETSYLLVPVLLFLGALVKEGSHRVLTTAAIVFASISMLYVPGLVWLLIPAIIWQRQAISRNFAELPKVMTGIIAFLGIVLLLPLVYALITGGNLWQGWLGYSGVFTEPYGILKNFLRVPLEVFGLRTVNPALGVGRLPYLDIATTVLTVLGCYWYFFQRKLDRFWLLVGCLLAGALITAVNGQLFSGLLAPFVYIVATGGITLLLQQWFTVFPRNPLARGIGITLVTSLIAVIGFYHLHRYFTVWPHTPATRDHFSVQL